MWLLNTPGFLHFSQQSLPEEEAYFQNSSYHEATSQSGTLTHLSSLAGRHTVQRFAVWSLASLKFTVYRRYKPPASQTSLLPEPPTPLHVAALALIPRWV